MKTLRITVGLLNTVIGLLLFAVYVRGFGWFWPAVLCGLLMAAGGVLLLHSSATNANKRE